MSKKLGSLIFHEKVVKTILALKKGDNLTAISSKSRMSYAYTRTVIKRLERDGLVYNTKEETERDNAYETTQGFEELQKKLREVRRTLKKIEG